MSDILGYKLADTVTSTITNFSITTPVLLSKPVDLQKITITSSIVNDDMSIVVKQLNGDIILKTPIRSSIEAFNPIGNSQGIFISFEGNTSLIGTITVELRDISLKYIDLPYEELVRLRERDAFHALQDSLSFLYNNPESVYLGNLEDVINKVLSNIDASTLSTDKIIAIESKINFNRENDVGFTLGENGIIFTNNSKSIKLESSKSLIIEDNKKTMEFKI